jgi:hypothetical protein
MSPRTFTGFSTAMPPLTSQSGLRSTRRPRSDCDECTSEPNSKSRFVPPFESIADGRPNHIRCVARVIPRRRRLDHGPQCLDQTVATGQESIDLHLHLHLQHCACGRRACWTLSKAEPAIETTSERGRTSHGIRLCPRRRRLRWRDARGSPFGRSQDHRLPDRGRR